MKTPCATLVVDAAILVAAVRGRSSAAVSRAAQGAKLAVTDRAIHEARRRIELGLKRPELLDVLDALVQDLVVVPVASLEPLLAHSEDALRNAVPSRNGSVRD